MLCPLVLHPLGCLERLRMRWQPLDDRSLLDKSRLVSLAPRLHLELLKLVLSPLAPTSHRILLVKSIRAWSS